jgi:serine/threonine-protein kinase HipA
MSVNGKFADFRLSDLLAEASRFGIGSAPTVIKEVQAAVRDWRKFASQAQLGAAVTRSIDTQLLRLDT